MVKIKCQYCNKDITDDKNRLIIHEVPNEGIGWIEYKDKQFDLYMDYCNLDCFIKDLKKCFKEK
jgi:hypothetical protein